jgi:hypothetical protein
MFFKKPVCFQHRLILTRFPACHEISSDTLRLWRCLAGSLPNQKYYGRKLKSLTTTIYRGGTGDFKV